MKRVLITGASSGIGLQLAKDYLNTGWDVIACGRNANKLELAFSGTDATTLCFDTTDQKVTEGQLGQIDPVDLVILNAGDCKYINDAKQFDVTRFNQIIDINVMGTANCIGPLVRNMLPGSRIAIVSSSCTFLPLPRAEAYGASKAALDYLARTLAADLHHHGIGISLIRPGFVDTPLTQKNNFAMPFLTPLPKASKYIREGLSKGKSEITFPPLFIIILKMLSALPRCLQHRMALGMVRKETSS